MSTERYIKDGKVAVLISPGFGAGWSTWNDEEYRDILLFDKRLVKAAMDGVRDCCHLVTGVIGIDEKVVFLDGWEDVSIEWLPVSTKFIVEEYNGNESILTTDDIEITA